MKFVWKSKIYRKNIIVLISFISLLAFWSLDSNPDLNMLEKLNLRSNLQNMFYGTNYFCHPKKHIMFLKTHKCGSSTIQKSMIPSHLLPSSGLVDIFCLHTRLNKTNLEEVLHKDTVWITIIRDPVYLYESLYNYFNVSSVTKLSLEQLMLHPVKNIMEMERVSNIYGFNQMLYDFGANPKLNITELEKKIFELDSLFDSILIMEKLEESLILMREKLCWTNDDIVGFTKNARRNKTKMNPKLVEKISNLNSADTIVYEYFLLKHNNAVHKFGPSRMKKEVIILKQKLVDYYELCVAEVVSGTDKRLEFKEWSNIVSSYIKRNDSSLDCHYLTLPEVAFVNDIRHKQIKYLSHES